MISRLSFTAAAFAVLATATLAYAAGVGPAGGSELKSAERSAPVVQLERVVVTAKRLPAQ